MERTARRQLIRDFKAMDLMGQQVDSAAATLLGAPQAPPVRPVAKTMEQSLAEARAKRQRAK